MSHFEWKDLNSILTPGICGSVALEKFTVEKSFYAAYHGIIPGEYIRLLRNGEVVMRNTPMEVRTNTKFCTDAHGDVLIGGLGVGMILLAIQDKPDVTSITVIEKSDEVISLVGSQLPLNSKVHVLHGDVFTWKPETGKRFDCIYMDIWDYINDEVYRDEMMPLKRKYGHYLKPAAASPNRFNRCWAEYNAKNSIPLR